METLPTTLLDKQNLGKANRAASLLAGAALLYSAVSGRKTAVKAIAGGYLVFRGVTGYCPMSDMLATDFSDAIDITHSLTVNRPREEAYRFWRNLSNLPLFMKHLKNVTEVSGTRSQWTALVPGKLGTVKWEAEITADVENELIGWHSLEGSTVGNMGHVAFRDAGKFGTEVYVTIRYKAPAGKIGEALGKLFNPFFSEMVKEDIKNFRRYIETGEIPTTEGQPGNS